MNLCKDLNLVSNAIARTLLPQISRKFISRMLDRTTVAGGEFSSRLE